MDLKTVFSGHHRLLDGLFETAQTQVTTGDWADARTTFRNFRAAIERHMQTEEAILFPAYEGAHGVDNPLTGILRKGHKDLRSFFDEIAEALDDADAEEAGALLGTAGQILLHHDAKEEEELYPATGPLLSEDTTATAARQLEPSN